MWKAAKIDGNKRKVVSIQPLTMMQIGETASVKQVVGKDEARSFLLSLGFVEGGDVTVVSELGGNLIVNVKGARVALSRVMASKIMV